MVKILHNFGFCGMKTKVLQLSGIKIHGSVAGCPPSLGLRDFMYARLNNEERSRNHCCRGKATSITYSECVSVALVIQHTMRISVIKLS
jgi:hypothetical protein